MLTDATDATVVANKSRNPDYLTRSGIRWVAKTLEYVKAAKQIPNLKHAMLAMLEAITRDALGLKPPTKTTQGPQQAARMAKAATSSTKRPSREATLGTAKVNPKGVQATATTAPADNEADENMNGAQGSAPANEHSSRKGESTSPATTGEEDGRI